MEDKNLIQIRELKKVYSGLAKPAVNGINLNIQEGEIFALLGPNGAGKTTTISILCGLIRPTSGQIKVNGYDLSADLDEIKKIIGIVPQDIALYPALSARENLVFFGNLYGLKGSLLNEKINYWLEMFGLSDKADKKVETYSGGMKRRANLVAGLLHDPKILFLDEPTVGIDVQSRNVIVELLKKLNAERGTTIIYTSHHMEEAEHLCSRIAIIDQGTIITKGKPSELLALNEGCHNLEDIFLKLTGRAIRD